MSNSDLVNKMTADRRTLMIKYERVITLLEIIQTAHQREIQGDPHQILAGIEELIIDFRNRKKALENGHKVLPITDEPRQFESIKAKMYEIGLFV